MKRVFLFRFLLISIIITSIVCICKYVFYRETKVSFPNKEVRIEDINSDTPSLVISIGRSLKDEDYYTIHVTKEQADCFLRNKYYIGYWYEMHLFLHFLFWLFTVLFACYYLWSVITVYNCLYDIGSNHFTACTSNCICEKRCNLYNSINDYDTTQIRKKWYNFWGYSV